VRKVKSKNAKVKTLRGGLRIQKKIKKTAHFIQATFFTLMPFEF